MAEVSSRADRILDWCRRIATFSEWPENTTRTFLSPPMHSVHAALGAWMEALCMQVRTDAVGNLRGLHPGSDVNAPRLLIGSHLDTVPCAGAFDGVLGVVFGIALVEALDGRRLRYGIEIVAFSEEEGVRFGIPFIGSRALVGNVDAALLAVEDTQGISVAQAIRDFGLDPANVPDAVLGDDVLGYLEFHIEQGPVLESLGLPLGVVEAIAGQSRLLVNFHGQANHAGTTPMHLRRDALAGAAEWMGGVEREALGTAGLVATVGRVEVNPGAGNIVPGRVSASLDVRHASDRIREDAVARMLACASAIALRRGLTIDHNLLLEQPAVACDSDLLAALDRAVTKTGLQPHRMVSGAGHDAMILAGRVPAAMLFLRSPGGISHHPSESVLTADVEAALQVGWRFLEELESRHA